jgi:aspartyl-tRNA(Asn)/glutamyl-tRNA(Gln) amidotransferase subunit B
MDYETVIGLEVHVQLKTATKMFCSSSAQYGAKPNHYIDPVTLGLPGSLPVVNQKAIEFAIILGLATNCEINKYNRFARKHYYYPDLPKGYQISQFEEPICTKGRINVHFQSFSRTIGITRIHMEEDAGKNIHDYRTGKSLIDLNRAGVPLLEVVSEPDLRSASEATAYLRTLHQLVTYLDICDGNMEEGSFRCDANVSLRPNGSLAFGTRTEIKNLNSFKFVEKAIEYEVARQLNILKSGACIVQETLLFDSDKLETRSMRGKEEAADYRYFPCPDLPPLQLSEKLIEEVRVKIPLLPDERVEFFKSTYGLNEYDARVLCSERENADFYEEMLKFCKSPKLASNWLSSELFGLLKKHALTIIQSPISARSLGVLVSLVESEQISGKIAKTVFEEMFETKQDPKDIVEKKGLKQIVNDEEILSLVKQAFDENPSQLKSYLEGKDSLHGFFVGQVMKKSQGSANPNKVNELIKKELQERK